MKWDHRKNLTEDGKERYGAEKHDFECFMLFWYFGEAVNRDLEHSRFRIQEINSTEISGDLTSDGPGYGRRYEIFYNQVKVGLLQIMARHRLRSETHRSVYAQIELDGAPVTAISYQPLSGFLHTIAGLVASTERKPYGDKTEYEEAKRTIDYNLAETMWNTVRDYTLGEPSWAELEVRLDGTPDRYYHIEAHERAKRMQARGDQAVQRSA